MIKTMRILAVALIVAMTTPVFADNPERCSDDATDSGDKKQGKFHIEYVGGKPVTVVDTIVTICGKVPRPSVAYVSTQKNIDYEWETLKQDFMPLILATVKKAPF